MKRPKDIKKNVNYDLILECSNQVPKRSLISVIVKGIIRISMKYYQKYDL